ncbi:uncharacterized protein LOC111519588 [Drosophila willistoni]|uniref:uncharacterized protein LOC111519588 n=1 Tax=Drosophila willistoni TaxID=7260 RepID=UPI001F07FE91|nr:uncharacterized protein LOC111519588 [Drosophila willistoni]
MDQAIINLMLWNTDASREDCASEANSMMDEFELMNPQCEGNCYQKVKSILQQAADTIKLKDQQIESKDRQIDNHMRTISTLSMKSLDIHKHYVENQMVEKCKEVSDLVSKYQDQLKESNALLKETTERLKSLETQKKEEESQFPDQTIAIEQVENQLTAKVKENEVLIQKYETQIKHLKDQIITLTQAPKEDNKDKESDYTKKLVWIPGLGPVPVTIENNFMGNNWMVICRNEETRGKIHLTIDIYLEHLYQLTKDFEQELCIRFDDKTRGPVHITEFSMYGKTDGYQVKTLVSPIFSNNLVIDRNIYDVVNRCFGSEPFTVMMRYKPKNSAEICSLDY